MDTSPEYIKMIKDKLLPFWDTGYLQFNDRGFNITPDFIKFTSMEQLWLAFIMREKYQKVWSGTEWVNGY